MNSEWLTDDERHMIQRCIDGDSYYEKKLYGSYIQAMYNRAVRMIGEHEAAKDVVQDSFIEVFKSLHKFRGDSTLGAWIKRIVIHSCISHMKRNKKFNHVSLNHIETEDFEYEREDENDLNPLAIYEAIKKLPEGCRNVLNLYLIEGYQHKEIAEIMEISESTSKTQYRRARQMLQGFLKKKAYG